VELTIETRGPDHADEIVTTLAGDGYDIERFPEGP
jgi:hypothetical protein